MGKYKKHSDRYPYLVVRAAATVYGIRPRPAGTPESALIREALVLALEKRVRVCAVFGPGRCAYTEPDGSFLMSETIPAGGITMKDDELIL